MQISLSSHIVFVVWLLGSESGSVVQQFPTNMSKGLALILRPGGGEEITSGEIICVCFVLFCVLFF